MNFTPLVAALDNIEVEKNGFGKVVTLARNARHRSNRVYFIGNGGSAAIASHMAIDWLNKGHFAAMSFTDPAALTCIGNDYGYNQVFKYQVMHHLDPGDLLFVISSSGRSSNVVEAAKFANMVCKVITLTGFDHDNDLRKLGTVNFYVPSRSYGVVETAHLAIMHELLELVTDPQVDFVDKV